MTWRRFALVSATILGLIAAIVGLAFTAVLASTWFS
jgi:biopolymer transport protein ExbB/TolQ